MSSAIDSQIKKYPQESRFPRVNTLEQNWFQMTASSLTLRK